MLSDREQHVSLRFSWEAEHPRWRFRGAKRRGGLGRLVRVLEGTRLPELPINVVYPERTLPARARKLVEFLIDRFATPQWQKSALLV